MTALKKLILSCILVITGAQAFTQEAGRPFIRNYLPPEYRASQQNWAVAQDSRGIMYFGNNDGLLEFDGTSWRLIKLPIVRTLAIDTGGRIYVGLENDMGYLEPDNSGSYQYYSLKAKIPEAHRDLSVVVYVYILGEKVIYLADDKIFIYQNDRIKVLTSEEGFHMIFTVRDRLYARERGKGLLYLDNDSLRFIPGSERFADERIYSMQSYRQNEILIATRTQGTFVYSPDRPDKFHKPVGFEEVDDFLLKNPVYCGIELAGGDFAVGALTGGIIVFSPEGKIKNRFNKATGLHDNTIYWLYADRNEQLWASLDNGISMIPVNLPFCYYSEDNGLNGSPMCLQFFNNRFYVGTSQYLHIRNRQGNFEQVAGTEGQNFHLFNADGTLLLAGYQGVFVIRDNRAIPLSNSIIGLSFCTLKDHPGYLLLGAADEGFYLMEKNNTSWKIKHHIKGFDKSIYEPVEDSSGNIWISTAVDLYKLRINNTLDSIISWRQYTSEDGLPSKYACPYKMNSGEVVFGSEKGVYRYRADEDMFEPHPDFQMFTGKVLPFVQFPNGDIWFEELTGNGNFEKGVLKYTEGKYVQFKTPFYKFIDIRCYESPFIFCPAPDGTVFIGTSSGLLQYKPSRELNIDQPFTTLIRNVYSGDKLLFGGAPSKLKDISQVEIKSIPFLHNDIIFHFAATFYEDPEKNLYSYRLIGSDTAWSDWATDQKKEYTNLREGKYTFEVRSQNQYRKIGSTAAFSFIIRPPWFRTWLAYMTYLILAVLLIWFIVKINIQRLVKQKENLEKIVAERTAQVNEQKKEIQQKNEVLNETNNKLNETNEELGSTLRIVSTQKTLIENAHKNITESINYARRIQQAVLPSDDFMSQSLPEHFILFKPCDVVSGDFYWVKKVDHYTIVATADCTGHGVPGAFMSMLGIGLLNEIVTDKNVNSSGEVLDRLRDELKKTLKQEGRYMEHKDGMDIALYVLDDAKMELQYAGAYNPLYLIRSNEFFDDFQNIHDYKTIAHENHTLVEIRADRQPIAIYDMEKPFTTHFIKLKKNDVIYTFSDGFVDQKGGPDNRKFLSHTFKTLLLNVHRKSMAEQREILDRTLESWKNGREQIDDILVIGVRI